MTLQFNPSIDRRLNIPRGVAHTFDRFQQTVWRNEPVWFNDGANSSWNLDSDLRTIPRGTPAEDFPEIAPNRHRLPFAGHILMSRFQQRPLG